MKYNIILKGNMIYSSSPPPGKKKNPALEKFPRVVEMKESFYFDERSIIVSSR